MRTSWSVLVLSVAAAAAGCEKKAPTAPPTNPAPPPPATADASPTTGMDLPQVPPAGLASPGDGWLLSVSKTAISIEGEHVLDLVGGKVDAADKEGGAHGMRIPALASKIAAYAQLDAEAVAKGTTPRTTPSPTLLVALDRAHTYEMLYQVLFTAKPTYKSFEIIARDGTSHLAIPITLPDRQPTDPAAPQLPPDEQPLEIVVALTKTEAILWSISQLEGSLQNPKAKVTLDKLADLGPALAEIVTRRWSGRTRTPEQQEIILMCDPETSMQSFATLAQLALAPGADGKPLFPRLVLAAGMQ
jgi:hypothetical protein